MDESEIRTDAPTTIARSEPENHESKSDPTQTDKNQDENQIKGKSEGEQSPEEAEYPTGLRFWLIMLALGAVTILVNIDMNIVATAVPKITDHFHTVADVGWYSAAFRLSLCAFQFLFGKIYSLYPVKPTFLVGSIIFLLGSVLCATATSSLMFVIGRAVTGLGAAGLNSGIIVVLVQSTPLRKRSVWMGLIAAIEGTSVLCGPLLGGVLVQYAGWRWCFYINLPLGGVSLLLTLFCITNTPKSSEIANLSNKEKVARIDILSNLIFIPSIISLFLALSWGGIRYSWASGRIIGLFVTASVLLLAFVFNQHRLGDRAALPPRILKQRSVAGGFLWIFFTNSAAQALEYYLPTYFQAIKGYTPSQSGYLLLPLIVLATIGAVVGGISISICGYYTPFVLASSLILPVSAGLVTTFGVHTHLAKLIIYTGLWGLAYGIGCSGPSIAVQTVLSPSDVPLGLAVTLFANSFGPSLSIVIAQVLFQSKLLATLRSVPDLDVSGIDNIGLTEFVKSVPPAQRGAVLIGISQSLERVWYLVVALASVTIIGGLLLEWRSVKSEKNQ